MFGKLLKNDLKAQFFSVFPILVVMAALIGAIEIWHYLGDSDAAKYVSGLLVPIVFLFACFIMIVAVASVFNHSLFGNEGYLTLSLPVKTHSLVFSKMLSGLIWIATPFILSIVSVFVWMLQTIAEFEEEVEMGEMLLQLFGAPSIDAILVYVLVFCIDLAILVILIVQCVYFGITLSHVSPLSKLGKLGAIIFTIVTFIVLNEAIDFFSEYIRFGVVIDLESYVFTDDVNRTYFNASPDAVPYNIFASLFTLLLSLGLNAPIVYLIKNKVNI